VSLNDVYAMGLKHALQVIEKNGGKISGNEISIVTEVPKPVRFEESFKGYFPAAKQIIRKELKDEMTFEFNGNGIVVRGEARPNSKSNWDYKGSFAFKAVMLIDGKVAEQVNLPVAFRERRHELFWKYNLPKGNHTVTLKLINPDSEFNLRVEDALIYSDTEVKTVY
jgi:hypothetical protein